MNAKTATLSVEEVYRAFRTDARGLSDAEAARRLAEFGPNRVARLAGPSWWARFVPQFTHFFAGILWLAALLAFVSEARDPGQGMGTLGVAIVLVVLVNGGFSFWQEERAERALEALERLLPENVTVVREGRIAVVAAESLVPGDRLVLEGGVRVPADARLVHAEDVRVDVSTLTGESVAVRRDAEPTPEAHHLRATNLVLAGTAILSGNAHAVVFASGSHTELASIAALAQAQPPVLSPLQREVQQVSRVIAAISIALALLFSALGALLGMPLATVLLFAIGIMVANVPEGLLPTTTLALAMASQRMARRNVVVRHLPAVEALGRASVICTDKTGTLTENRMVVREVNVAGSACDASDAAAMSALAREHGAFFRTLYHCEDVHASPPSGGRMLGDPMEIALVEMAMAALGRPPRAPRLDTMPFDSDRRRMAVLHADGAGYVVYAKGALDAIFGVASSVREGNAVLPLDDAARLRWLALEARLGGRGFRVLAVAYRRLVERPARSELERELVLLGLVALADPPRPEVPEAIRRCTEAGIRVVMLTGDHPRTALAIAQQIGLASASCRVILGSELEHMKDARLQLALDEEVLFARVRADQKHRVVMAFQKKRAIVAVTGDGVNDAPALRAADVGIAMGKSGTDVARESSDVVLLDDNFASIVAGVEEGRAVYANLRKFLTYVLASNVPELVPYLAFALLGVPLPLTIVQILAVDLGTDLVPALGLGAESPEPDTMRASPLPRSERLLSRRLLVRAYAVLGVSEALASMGGYATVLWLGGYRLGAVLPRDSVLYRQATTACFGGIVAMQVANVFCCRSESRSPFARGGARNAMLLFGVGLEIVLLTGIVVTPLGQRVFGTAPPQPLVWLLFVPFAALHLALDALSKRWFFGRRVTSRSS